jgi:hypothetical protein
MLAALNALIMEGNDAANVSWLQQNVSQSRRGDGCFSFIRQSGKVNGQGRTKERGNKKATETTSSPDGTRC